jgi:hypothetical protein
MSKFNINEVFSYQFPTSSINYIRNYNFNTTTATHMPLTLINTGSLIPITVNLKVNEPWIKITNAEGSADLRYPSGNVVLSPTSSAQVFIIIDLPPEIEAQSGSITLRPNISVEALSGSFPIVPRTVETETTGSSTLTKSDYIVTELDNVSVVANQTILLSFVIYDENLVPNYTVPREEIVLSLDDATIISADWDYEGASAYSPIIIRGLAVGTTRLNISAVGYTTQVEVEVTSDAE